MNRDEVALQIYCAYLGSGATAIFPAVLSHAPLHKGDLEAEIRVAFRLADKFIEVAHATAPPPNRSELNASTKASAFLLDLGEVTGSGRGSL